MPAIPFRKYYRLFDDSIETCKMYPWTAFIQKTKNIYITDIS